jgi:hypothetical protein
MINSLIKNEHSNYTRGENKTRQYTENVNVVDGVVRSVSNNIYYNLSIINQVETDPLELLPSVSVPKKAEFNTQRSSSIISKPSDYRIAVSRFSIPSGLIPLGFFPKNASYYTITLTYDDGLGNISQFTSNLTYVPSSVGDPYAQGGNQPFYYIQEIVNYINIAFEDAYNQAKLALGATYTPKDRPYITYDSKTKLLTMWAEDEYKFFDTFGIFANTTLFEAFLSGFYAREATNDQLDDFNGFQFIIQDLLTNRENNITLPDGTVSDFYKLESEFSTIPLFNQLDRILLTTTSIPINTQLIGTQKDVRAGILLDYILPDNVQTKQKYEYIPQPNYKWTDMQSDVELTKIDIQIFLVYNTGEITPLYIQSDQRVDITLLFCPKGQIYL